MSMLSGTRCVLSVLLFCFGIASGAEPDADTQKQEQAITLSSADVRLVVAAKKNDFATAQAAVKAGANVNACDNGSSALLHAVEHKDLKFVTWLVNNGAQISTACGPSPILVAEIDNHLGSYTNQQRAIAAFLMFRSLSQQGKTLPRQIQSAELVAKIKEVIKQTLRQAGYWLNDATGSVVRIAEVQYQKEKDLVVIYADVAVWNAVATYEVASVTGRPARTGNVAGTHAWLEKSGENAMLNTQFVRDRVLLGAFIVPNDWIDRQASTKRR